MGHPREGTAEPLPHPAISKPDLPKAAGSDSNTTQVLLQVPQIVSEVPNFPQWSQKGQC